MNSILSSINWYTNNGGDTFTSVFGKKIQQTLRHWGRQLHWDRYVYDKYETYNGAWWLQSKALQRKPLTSNDEKIIDILSGSRAEGQLWAYIN